MAAALNSYQGPEAAGRDALARRWSPVAVPAAGIRVSTMNATSPTAFAMKHRNGITGGPQEGSS